MVKQNACFFRQNGSALIAALFIMLLTVITVTALSSDIQMMIQRLNLQTNNQQLYFAAQGGVYWGKSFLTRELPVTITGSLGFIPPFPQQLQQETPEKIDIQIRLENAESRFNINNLIPLAKTKEQLLNTQKSFAKLLQTILPSLTNEKALQVAQNMSVWLGHQENIHGIILPQVAFVPSQLSLKEWELLQPYLVALPEYSLINLNTAPAPIIQAVTGLTKEQTQLFLQIRKQVRSFHDLRQLQQYPNLPPLNISPDAITLLGQFYLITVIAKKTEQTSTIQALLQREVKNNKVNIRLWWQVFTPIY